MIIRRYGFLFVFLFVLSLLNAQNELSLEDVIAGGKNYKQFRPQKKDYRFLGKKDDFLLIEKDKAYKNGSEIAFLQLDRLNETIAKEGIAPLGNLRRCRFNDNESLWFISKNNIVSVSYPELKIETNIVIPEAAEFLDFDVITNRVIYLFDGDLYYSTMSQNGVKIESSTDKDIVLGKSVHRNEFGINGGIFMSPKGNYVAFYRKDEHMVTDYPLVDVTKRVAEVENIKYPMAGMSSHEVTVGVYNFATQKLVYLKTGAPKDKYLTNVGWSKDERYITVSELNREQDFMKFNVYDPVDGELIKTLFEETSDKWVEPEHKPLFFSKKPNLFLWQSERDGYNHIYLYDINKGLVKQITKGNYVVTDLLGLRNNDNTVFFQSTKNGYLERHLYQVNVSNGKVKKLTENSGYHKCQLSFSGDKVLDQYSALNVPGKLELLDLKKNQSQLLFEAKNPFEDYNIGKIELGKLKAADGQTDLSYRMVLPVDFNPDKKYPVVVYVYGGPHAQLVSDSWLGQARLWQIYMSQLGYISFTMDNRGTPYRGCDFEKVIHRKLGENECEDQYEGVKYLKSLNYVDSTRIGVHGWSFGGFMTINLMEKYPDDFKVGVCGGPVTDWKYYEVMYGERYMDMPKENPEGYDITNLNKRVDRLKGKLLVIHGAIDPTVVWQHSLDFIEQCIKQRVQVDYFVYPRHQHNVLGPDRVHLMQKVTQYFEDYL